MQLPAGTNSPNSSPRISPKADTSIRIRDFRVGEVYHVYQQGNHSRLTYHDAAAKLIHLERLFNLAKTHGVLVHNFCFMDNHVHLVLEPQQQDSISKMMQAWQQVHALHHNRRMKRTGNLWQQHFACKRVRTPAYYQTLMRYVENRPVVGRRVKSATDFLWSGALAHVLGRQVPITVGEHTVMTELHLEGWRQRCPATISLGWLRFLSGRHVDSATMQHIRSMQDGKLRRRLALQEHAKLRREAKTSAAQTMEQNEPRNEPARRRRSEKGPAESSTAATAGSSPRNDDAPTAQVPAPEPAVASDPTPVRLADSPATLSAPPQLPAGTRQKPAKGLRSVRQRPRQSSAKPPSFSTRSTSGSSLPKQRRTMPTSGSTSSPTPRSEPSNPDVPPQPTAKPSGPHPSKRATTSSTNRTKEQKRKEAG